MFDIGLEHRVEAYVGDIARLRAGSYLHLNCLGCGHTADAHVRGFSQFWCFAMPACDCSEYRPSNDEHPALRSAR